MKIEYVHQELDKELLSISGNYTPLKELRLKHDDREILCVVGNAVVDTACCGSGSFLYAIVPGYIVTWKEGENKSGSPVSEVEPIYDEKVKREVANIIRETESIHNINFW
jgi:hypothetical protein